MRASTRGLQALALLAVASLLGVLVWRIAHRTHAAVPVVIDPHHPVTSPAFELPRLTGSGKLTLESLRGKAVVLNFWASWCYPCKQELPALEAAWRQYRSRGLVVVGVDVMDAGGDARSLARRIGITYPLVRDDAGALLDQFSVLNLPETLFVNRHGKIVASRLEGGVELKRNQADFQRGIRLALEA
jgi:peroxiredoxin